MTALDAMTLRIAPGAGTVARSPGAVLLVAACTGGQRTALESLVAICRAGATAPGAGRRLVRRAAGVLVECDPDDVPAFALLAAVDQDTTAVIVSGDVDAELTLSTGERLTLSGTESATWVDRLVRGLSGVRLAPTSQDLAFDAITSLDAGVVHAAAVLGVLAGSEPPTTNARPAAPETAAPRTGAAPGVAEPVPPAAAPRAEPVTPALGEEAAPFHVLVLTDATDDDPLPPLPVPGESADGARPAADGVVPAAVAAAAAAAAAGTADGVALVEGVVCSLRHLNDPRALFCSSCGRSLVHVTHQRVEGVRPSLGVLVLDDSSIYPLTGDYVVGRDPGLDERVGAGGAKPLALNDQDSSVSRVHADVRLVGWDVVVEDRSSANGTYVAEPGGTQWRPLEPGQPLVLQPGFRVRIGDRVLQFESPHRIATADPYV